MDVGVVVPEGLRRQSRVFCFWSRKVLGVMVSPKSSFSPSSPMIGDVLIASCRTWREGRGIGDEAFRGLRGLSRTRSSGEMDRNDFGEIVSVDLKEMSLMKLALLRKVLDGLLPAGPGLPLLPVNSPLGDVGRS